LKFNLKKNIYKYILYKFAKIYKNLSYLSAKKIKLKNLK